MGRRRPPPPKQDPGGCGLLIVILIILIAIGKCSAGSDAPVGEDNIASIPATSDGAADKRFVSSDALNCRSAGKPSARVISRLAFGDSVSVRQESGGWSEVDAGGTSCWAASRFLSESYPVRSLEPISYTPAPREVVRPRRERRLQCSGKRTCGEMNSCAEANFYLEECGVSRLDGDGDGVPCESICG